MSVDLSMVPTLDRATPTYTAMYHECLVIFCITKSLSFSIVYNAKHRSTLVGLFPHQIGAVIPNENNPKMIELATL